MSRPGSLPRVPAGRASRAGRRPPDEGGRLRSERPARSGQFFLPRHEGMLFQIDTLAFFEKDARILSKLPAELTVIE